MIARRVEALKAKLKNVNPPKRSPCPARTVGGEAIVIDIQICWICSGCRRRRSVVEHDAALTVKFTCEISPRICSTRNMQTQSHHTSQVEGKWQV
jgi:hypothetical protein